MYDRLYKLLLEASGEEVKYKRQRHLKSKIKKRLGKKLDNTKYLKDLNIKDDERPFGTQHSVDFDLNWQGNRKTSLPRRKDDRDASIKLTKKRKYKVNSKAPTGNRLRKQTRKDRTGTEVRKRLNINPDNGKGLEGDLDFKPKPL